MSNILRSHDLKQVQLTIDGVPISGFAESGKVTFEFSGDAWTNAVGSAGEVTTSKSNDSRVVATITCRQGGRGHTVLGSKFQEQQRQQGPVKTMRFFMLNPVTGEKISDDQAVFQTRPAPSQEVEAGDREFTILLPYGEDNHVYGTPVGG